MSPVVTTTYSVTTTNIYSCTDTNHYTVSPNISGNGKTSSTAIVVSPSTNVSTTSYSSGDSVVWFSFSPTDSNNQIIAYSNYLSLPVPHVHRLTLYDNSLNMLVDKPMPDISGANQIRIDISHLHPGSTYYVRAARCPAHANMAGCNPTGDVCNAFQRWDFQMCFRTVPVFVPNDSGAESPSVSQLYYESRGQIPDLNKIPRFDIKAYTNNTKLAVFCSDSAVSFVYQHIDTAKSFIDTVQRVDMVLTGAYVQPSQPVFKTEEDSGAGYLNYFLGYVPNGVPKVEGYSRLVYKNVYPNLDMQLSSNNLGTKIYFICNPAALGGSGGNPADIELEFKGATSVNVTGAGGLNVVTELGTFSFAPGYAYTDSAGIIKPKSWQPYFIAVNSNTVKFNTGSYNVNEPLVIRIDRGHKAVGSYPPIGNLDWSTYFGGANNEDMFSDVCSDAVGNVYAAGSTESMFYPVTNGVVQDTLYSAPSNFDNATLAKFDSLDQRAWATYFGADRITLAYGVAVDASKNIYITGLTESFFLPFPSNPSSPNNYYQPLLGNGYGTNSDAFIAMFSNDGTKTYWTTYYGGAGAEQGNHIAIDVDTNVYIVGGGVLGSVYSTFPLQKSSKAGAYNDSTYGRGFILEFNASNAFNPTKGIKLEWATRIGDTNHNTDNNTQSHATLNGCTVDASNNFYVTGIASGYGYTSPATLTFPYEGVAFNRVENAVVSKFNANNNVVWSSYYGGNNGGAGDAGDAGYAVTIDQSGNTYITGNALSDSSSGTGIEKKQLGGGFIQENNPTLSDGFIAEFSSSGSLKWGTYFGGSNFLYGQALCVDAYNNLYLTGYVSATGMPLPGSNPAGTYSQLSYVNGNNVGDAFIAAFSNANTSPAYVWGTYFGSNRGSGLCITHYNGGHWLYLVGNIGGGYTPLVFPARSYQQDTFYFNLSNATGTSFISLFDIDPIIGPASVNTINSPIGEVNVYPNPTNQNVTVLFNASQNEDVEFSLYNLMGEMVYERKVSEQVGTIDQEIDMTSLPNGIYLLKVNEGDKYLTQKIVKQN